MVPNATKVGTNWLGMRILGDFKGPKQALGPSQGVRGGTKEAPRRHQGATEEAPRRHQGSTREAPRRQLDIGKNPRPIKKRTTI